ncbi:putative glutamine amidotransferase [Saccharicrinis carchari]|uniref:gamma-glutamyl-gamma-aminobutyrate hydrolase n=1 Tax=Saccharicrinis carchari TaxID=1168039 RepID=A0A521AX65_SACCC|nr:gamma-glutamyl-gamma-aminobutyrate hydrolase family protein [Saccharicrinis carchari]SMO39379.1 putative glutamine amidotransferase [Saccharicrinis carchari]
MKRALSYFLLLLLVLPAYAQDLQKPIIGLSSTSGGGTSTSVPLTYVQAVIRAGGVPMILPITHDHELLKRMLDNIDALILTGGEDVDPLKWYGEEPLPALGGIAPRRDSFDVALARLAVERNIPLLGICRGHQVINVAFGGTLYQDIPSQVKDARVKHRQNAAANYGTHSIRIEQNSLLHQQIGTQHIAVNSFHHQAVKDVAPGFKVTATSVDGVVEAMEKTDSDQVYSVQFHPEGFIANDINTFLGIFEYLVKKAEQHERKKKQ